MLALEQTETAEKCELRLRLKSRRQLRLQSIPTYGMITPRWAKAVLGLSNDTQTDEYWTGPHALESYSVSQPAFNISKAVAV